MDSASDELLASSALALDHHRARDRSHLLDLHQHLANRVALSDQTGDFNQPPSIERTLHNRNELLGRDRFRINIDEPDCAQALLKVGILYVSKTDYIDTVPQLIAHELHVRWISDGAGQHEQVRLRSPDLSPYVIERRHHHCVDSRFFQ
ncbi:MAG: hypothetical protein ACXVIJ_04785 [Thermoanaerobaculia bacterium]